MIDTPPLSASARLPAPASALTIQRLGFAFAFVAISFTTWQGLMLTTRVYASYSAATFVWAMGLAALLTPPFFFALKGLAPGVARIPISGQALLLGCAYLMGLVAVFDLNASLDRSAPVETSFVVVAHRSHEDNDGTFVNIFELARPTTRFAAADKGLAPLPFTLNDIDEMRVEPGRSRIVVPMRAGLFGIPWFPVSGYRLEGAEGA